MVSEEGIEKALEDIEQLKKQIKSLRTQINTLKSKIELFEVTGFQDQISKLDESMASFAQQFNDKMQDYDHELLGLECYVSAAKVNENLDKFCNHVDNSKLRNKADLRTQIIADAASTKTEIFTSKNPSRISYEFYERWAKYLSDKGINLLVV